MSLLETIKSVFSNRTSGNDEFNIEDLITGNLKTVNKNANNIVNSENVNCIGNNYGNKIVNGDEILNVDCTVNILVQTDATKDNINKNVDTNNQRLIYKIKDIENLQKEHKYEKAIEMYTQMIMETIGQPIDDDITFEIFNNIFLCYVNLGDFKNAQSYIKKIERLDIVNGIEKFYFIRGIYHLNMEEYEEAYVYVNDALNVKSDYIKAQMLQYLLEIKLEYRKYEAIKETIVTNCDDIKLKHEENQRAYIFSMLGHMSLISREYIEAVKYFTKSDEIEKNPFSRAKIALSYFNNSVKNSIIDNLIVHENIDYEELLVSMKIYEELIFEAEKKELKGLLRECVPIYVKILLILGKVEKVNNRIEDIGLYCEKGDYNRIKALIDYSSDDNTKVMDEVDTKERILIQCIDLYKKKAYEKIIEILSGVIWLQDYNDIRCHHILLTTLLYSDKLDEFCLHLKTLRERNIDSYKIDFIEGMYYEKIGNKERCESILLTILENNNDYFLYIEILKFYLRNNYTEKFEGLIDNIFNNKVYVIELASNEFYFTYFQFLIKSRKIDKAIDIYESLTEGLLNKVDYFSIGADIYSLMGNHKIAASKCEELYVITRKNEDLVNALNHYMCCYDLRKSEEIVKILLRNGCDKDEELYAIYSNIEIFKGNTEQAYEYAKKAKELSKYKPYSNIHPFYVQKSIRCNKEEGIGYVSEFAETYPKINNWLKPMKVIEEEKNSEERLSDEVLDFLKRQKDFFDNIMTLYRNYNIGITILTNQFGHYINETINWRDIYNIEINMSSGDIEELDCEIKKCDKEIVVDPLSLYILQEINALYLLNCFDKVYLTYSSLIYIQEMILYKEDSHVRNILEYFNKALNFEIVYPDYQLSSTLCEKYEKVLGKYSIETLIYAYKNNLPYLYGDFMMKNSIEDLKIKTISIMAMLNYLLKNNKITKIQFNLYLLLLKKKRYSFVNFDNNVLYYLAQENNFNINDDIKLFFRLKKTYDLKSFLYQYFDFLSQLYNEIINEKFEQYYKLFISTMDKLYKQSYYYDYIFQEMLRRKYGINNEYKLNSNEMLYYKDIIINECINSYDFQRCSYIKGYCRAAIKYSLLIFRENREDLEYYCKKNIEIVKNIPKDVFKDMESEVIKIIEDKKL